MRPSHAGTAIASRRSVRSARLLVIDDEPDIGKLFLRIFRRKHDVVYERDAATALARIVRGERFDIIFCDLMMPRMSGTAFIAQIATLYPQELERIVVITGGSVSEDARRFLAETARRVLYKPFSLDELEAVMSDMLGCQCA